MRIIAFDNVRFSELGVGLLQVNQRCCHFVLACVDIKMSKYSWGCLQTLPCLEYQFSGSSWPLLLYWSSELRVKGPPHFLFRTGDVLKFVEPLSRCLNLFPVSDLIQCRGHWSPNLAIMSGLREPSCWSCEVGLHHSWRCRLFIDGSHLLRAIFSYHISSTALLLNLKQRLRVVIDPVFWLWHTVVVVVVVLLRLKCAFTKPM